MGLLDELIVRGLPLVPRPIVGSVAARYVAGESLEEAVATVRRLKAQGLEATLALLGEEVVERQRAEAAVAEYREILARLAASGVHSHISIKLTLLGLKIDEGFCRANLEQVVEAACAHDNFVRIDMEDHTCTDPTLRLYRELRRRCGNVGAVLQAYLRRTPDDVSALPETGANVRLCKGIYREPPEVAFAEHQAVRDQFKKILEALFDRGAYVAIATHDPYLLDAARSSIERRGLGPERYEFQTLLGVTEALRDRLLEEGHRVRVYVPYGADWYAYSIRRLRENPRIAWHVMRALVGRR